MTTLADRFRRWYEYERDCNAVLEACGLTAGLEFCATDPDQSGWAWGYCMLTPEAIEERRACFQEPCETVLGCLRL